MRNTTMFNFNRSVSVQRRCYTFLLYLLFPLIIYRLIKKSKQQPEYRQDFTARLGRPTGPAPSLPVIWLHAVSVGETRAAQVLVEQLLQHYPAHQIIITNSTPTGRHTTRSLFDNRVINTWLPYDYPCAIKKFLSHYKPVLGLIMETEIWCNLIYECNRNHIPVILINARLSSKSLRQYLKFKTLSSATLKQLHAVMAQTKQDQENFAQLNTMASIMGNMKYDIKPSAQLIQQGQALKGKLKNRPIILLASSRDQEEALFLNMIQPLLTTRSEWLLFIVPRHPERIPRITALLTQKQISYHLKSKIRPDMEAATVVIGDTMGEMPVYYQAADLTIMGGTLLDYGGQNFMESLAVGTPVILGPSIYNFKLAATQAIQDNACVQFNDIRQLPDLVEQLLEDTDKRSRMANNGRQFIQQNEGATQRVLEQVSLILKNG